MSRIIIIDNGSNRIQALAAAFPTHEASVITYQGKVDHAYLHSFDAIVLSGSSKNEANHPWYDAEVQLIRESERPILGICLGLELICRAFGVAVERAPFKIEGSFAVATEPAFQAQFSGQHIVHEAHKWLVPTVPADDFEILFVSPTGVEGIKHVELPIVGVQFHPEVPTGLDPEPVTAASLLSMILAPAQELSFPAVVANYQLQEA